MKGDPRVIGVLNDLLTTELTAVHQYLLHARMCDDWGYERLYAKLHDESRDELNHADELVERILYLEGAPDGHARVRTLPVRVRGRGRESV
jgi:bacterioferritin